jgi:L-ascorbate metabolism protein UlaG (beta-lactamase superfamily)
VLLTKFTHACVRLEDQGRVLVIDPGIWAEPEAFDGATDLLITHEHVDHIDLERVKAHPALSIYTNAEFAVQLGLPNVTAIEPGQTFTAAGFTVQATGGRHADIYGGLPGCANLGFLVEGVYHPGDSLYVPDAEVETLLVPASGPWLKFGEAIEFTRAVKPRQAIPIHEALLTGQGMEYFDGWLQSHGGTSYSRLAAGTQMEV